MSEMEIEPRTGADAAGAAHAAMTMANEFINPDNPNINLKSFDDVLDACFLIRHAVVDLFNAEVERITGVIKAEEKENAAKALSKRLEKMQIADRRTTVNGPEALKQIIREVKAYDHLKSTPMGRAQFVTYCEEINVPREKADQIFFAHTFDIERRRALISDNIMMLSE